MVFADISIMPSYGSDSNLLSVISSLVDCKWVPDLVATVDASNVVLSITVLARLRIKLRWSHK